MSKTVTLIAYDDGKETLFPARVELLKESVTLSNMLEDFGSTDDDTKIPLEKIKANSLRKIIEYLEHIESNQAEKVDMSALRDRDLNDWEKKFCEMPQEEIFELMLAVNYLDIKHLLDVTAKSVALSMKGLTAEQIREKFGIVNDWTEDELQQVKRENEWLNEK